VHSQRQRAFFRGGSSVLHWTPVSLLLVAPIRADCGRFRRRQYPITGDDSEKATSMLPRHRPKRNVFTAGINNYITEDICCPVVHRKHTLNQLQRPASTLTRVRRLTASSSQRLQKPWAVAGSHYFVTTINN